MRSVFSNIGSEGKEGNGGSFLSSLSREMGVESLRGDTDVVLDTLDLLEPAVAADDTMTAPMLLLLVVVLVFSFLRFKYSCRLTCKTQDTLPLYFLCGSWF